MAKITLTNETTYYPSCGCRAYPEYEEVGTIEVTNEQLERIHRALNIEMKDRVYTEDFGIEGEDIGFTSFVEVS